MSVGRMGGVRLALALLPGLAGGLAPAAETSAIADALSLYRQRRFAEAKAVLEPLAASQPANAQAAYYLGMAFLRAGGKASLDTARSWLGKAVKLDPDDASFLADYAGVCLMCADRDNSLSDALEGRDAMTRAIAKSPRDVGAREGLMEFYAKAPWPIGDADKALALAAEIAAIDPRRGAAAYRTAQSIFEAHGQADRARDAALAAQNLARGRPQ